MPSVKEISHRLYIFFHINFIFHINLYKREHWFIRPVQCLYAHWEVRVTRAIKYPNLVVHQHYSCADCMGLVVVHGLPNARTCVPW